MSSEAAQADCSLPGDPASEPLACVSCRSRKLKCDRVKPACGRCSKISAECVFPESRRKPAFKRRNVKELEERLAQVEGLLKENAMPSSGTQLNGSLEGQVNIGLVDFTVDMETVMAMEAGLHENTTMPSAVPAWVPDTSSHESQFNESASFSGELIELGLSESLPPMDLMEELNGIFFQRQYHSIPIIHVGRYTQAFYSAPHKRPPMCLQYAIWAMASNGHEKYGSYHDVFYSRARQYAQADEMKGYGEHFLSVAHAQAWALIATNEARCMYFTRAALSGAKSVRLVEMMGLHRLDGPAYEMAPTLGPATCWTDLEERRRTFWGVYCIDVHTSISTGWPALIDPNEISTHLPSSEEAFSQGNPEEATTIEETFKGSSYSTFAGTIIICYLFNRVLKHVHRAKPDDRPEDFEYGEFWTRHRELDNTISSTFMFLPERFRLPKNLRDPTAVHTNLNLHASVICIHHAAMDKINQHKLPESLRVVCLNRLRTAAEEVANIMRLTSHLTATYRSPLVALSMYCAISVYTSIAKDKPEDMSSTDINNIELIVRAMEAVAREHRITQSFLNQVFMDIKNNGLESIIRLPNINRHQLVYNPICTSIPLLARSSISRHTEIQPPLPGRLPLDKPIGSLGRVSYSDNLGCGTILSSVVDDTTGNKRKRMATPDQAVRTPGSLIDDQRPHDSIRSANAGGGKPAAGKPFGSAILRASGVMATPNAPPVNIPYRSWPSPNSASQTQSGSSRTTPGTGLETTPEDESSVPATSHTQPSMSEWGSADPGLYAQYATPIANFDFDASPTVDPWNLMNNVDDLTWHDGDRGHV